jgi:hypothetical protein
MINIKLIVLSLIIVSFLKPYSTILSDDVVSDDLIVTEYSHKDLLKWERSGKGIVGNGSHGQMIMSETQDSKGIMIVSPEIYKDNVLLSYDVMTLRAATVLIVEFLAHNTENFDLNFPADYDGNVKYLFENVNMYMFAFHNAAHNKPGPFMRKYPDPGIEPLVKSEKSYMQTGIYYHIELGKMDNKLFLKIDGKTVLETTDPDCFEGGKLAIRIRGTAHELASCLIRNVKIYSSASSSVNKK